MDSEHFNPGLSVADLFRRWPSAVPVFLSHHLSCVGCPMNSFDTLQDVVQIYCLDAPRFFTDLEQALQQLPLTQPAPQPLEKGKTCMPDFVYFEDIVKESPVPPAESIVSRSVLVDKPVKAILFSFAQGQELSEHTASVPAMIQILEGEAYLTLGTAEMEAGPGAWAYMEPNLPHSLLARTPVKMLLLMLR